MVHPEKFDWAVPRTKFLKLSPFHPRIFTRSFGVSFPIHCSGPVPVSLRKIECKSDPVFITRLAELGQYINPQRTIYHLFRGCFSIPQAESVVVLGQVDRKSTRLN